MRQPKRWLEWAPLQPTNVLAAAAQLRWGRLGDEARAAQVDAQAARAEAPAWNDVLRAA